MSYSSSTANLMVVTGATEQSVKGAMDFYIISILQFLSTELSVIVSPYIIL